MCLCRQIKETKYRMLTEINKHYKKDIIEKTLLKQTSVRSHYLSHHCWVYYNTSLSES